MERNDHHHHNNNNHNNNNHNNQASAAARAEAKAKAEEKRKVGAPCGGLLYYTCKGVSSPLLCVTTRLCGVGGVSQSHVFIQTAGLKK
jgi:hypothetical protein